MKIFFVQHTRDVQTINTFFFPPFLCPFISQPVLFKRSSTYHSWQRFPSKPRHNQSTSSSTFFLASVARELPWRGGGRKNLLVTVVWRNFISMLNIVCDRKLPSVERFPLVVVYLVTLTAWRALGLLLQASQASGGWRLLPE